MGRRQLGAFTTDVAPDADLPGHRRRPRGGLPGDGREQGQCDSPHSERPIAVTGRPGSWPARGVADRRGGSRADTSGCGRGAVGVTRLVWLAGAVVLGVAAVAIAWTAWGGYWGREFSTIIVQDRK